MVLFSVEEPGTETWPVPLGFNTRGISASSPTAETFGPPPVASFSIYSPHAGAQFNKDIPIAAISIEDAEMFQRMQDRKQKITVHLAL